MKDFQTEIHLMFTVGGCTMAQIAASQGLTLDEVENIIKFMSSLG
jgi:hypothetical protein